VCARARASAVPPRTTGRAASSEARPSASAIVRAAGPEAAHTSYMFDTNAVFHAPMFALNADANANACAPRPHAVHADGQGLARFGADACAPKHARTHARAPISAHGCASGAHARIGDPILQCASIPLRAFIVLINATCVCSIDLAS
jgi:hypothetical protein